MDGHGFVEGAELIGPHSLVTRDGTERDTMRRTVLPTSTFGMDHVGRWGFACLPPEFLGATSPEQT